MCRLKRLNYGYCSIIFLFFFLHTFLVCFVCNLSFSPSSSFPSFAFSDLLSMQKISSLRSNIKFPQNTEFTQKKTRSILSKNRTKYTSFFSSFSSFSPPFKFSNSLNNHCSLALCCIPYFLQNNFEKFACYFSPPPAGLPFVSPFLNSYFFLPKFNAGNLRRTSIPPVYFCSFSQAPLCFGAATKKKEEKLQKMAKPSVVFVLGGPGAGKGTQCEKIAKNLGYHHISAGDCLREERNVPNSEYGELIESYIRDGKIVPVKVTVSLLRRKMSELGWVGGRFVIDGFPRNKDNLDGWSELMPDVNVLFCLFFDCDEQQMLQRLLERGKNSGRIDDNVESIQKRFATYKNDTMPIIQEFEKQNKCRKICAMGAIDEIWEEVQKIFKEKENENNMASQK